MNQEPTQNPNADIYPKPQDPAPSATQPPAPQQTQNPPQKSSTTKTVLIVCSIILAAFLIIIGVLAAMVFFGLNGARGKAKDASIKSSVSSIQFTAANYFDTHSDSYVGLEKDSNFITAQTSVKSKSSEIKYQAISQKSYLIYAYLPDAKQYFCIDATGFVGEIASVSPTQTTCK